MSDASLLLGKFVSIPCANHSDLSGLVVGSKKAFGQFAFQAILAKTEQARNEVVLLKNVGSRRQ